MKDASIFPERQTWHTSHIWTWKTFFLMKNNYPSLSLVRVITWTASNLDLGTFGHPTRRNYNMIVPNGYLLSCHNFLELFSNSQTQELDCHTEPRHSVLATSQVLFNKPLHRFASCNKSRLLSEVGLRWRAGNIVERIPINNPRAKNIEYIVVRDCDLQQKTLSSNIG